MNKKVVTIAGYSYHIFTQINDEAITKWVLLHGFMGTHHDFDAIIKHLPGEVMTFDLLGFGAESTVVIDPTRFDMAAQISDIQTILQTYEWSNVNLLGYSMGGRLALGFALKHNELVNKLFLESSSAGLNSSLNRKKRRTTDNEKVTQIMTNFREFVLNWEKLPLFATQKALTATQRQKIRIQRLAQQPQNVANSLKYMGTGVQVNFWPKLAQLKMPTVLLVGELDQKFNQIADEMIMLLPDGQKHVIKNAGHNIHVEQPNEVIEVLKNVSY